MNDCPRRYTQKKALIGQFHLMYVINRSGGFQIVSALYSCRMRRERLILPTKAPNSIYCRDGVGLISVAHQAFCGCHQFQTRIDKFLLLVHRGLLNKSNFC